VLSHETNHHKMDLQSETNVEGSTIRLKVSCIAHGIQLQVSMLKWLMGTN
jgi:hypothetical protein